MVKSKSQLRKVNGALRVAQSYGLLRNLRPAVMKLSPHHDAAVKVSVQDVASEAINDTFDTLEDEEVILEEGDNESCQAVKLSAAKKPGPQSSKKKITEEPKADEDIEDITDSLTKAIEQEEEKIDKEIEGNVRRSLRARRKTEKVAEKPSESKEDKATEEDEPIARKMRKKASKLGPEQFKPKDDNEEIKEATEATKFEEASSTSDQQKANTPSGKKSAQKAKEDV